MAQCQCTYFSAFHDGRCTNTASFSVVRKGKTINVCGDCCLSSDKDKKTLHDEVLDSRDEY